MHGVCWPPAISSRGHPHDSARRPIIKGEGQAGSLEPLNQLGLTDRSSQKSSQKILVLLKAIPEMTIAELAMALVLTDRAIKKQLEKLKLSGRVRRVGPDKGGHWEVLA